MLHGFNSAFPLTRHQMNLKGSEHQDCAQQEAQSADTSPPGVGYTEPAKNLDTLASGDEVDQSQAPVRP
jgi:hypothetical protein